MSTEALTTTRPTGGQLSTGRLIPALTALVGGLIVFSGFLPLKWFRFQDYEIARQVLQWDAPFIPNLHMRRQFYVGDEAVSGNLAPTESLNYRNFTTDRLGFRYCPPVQPGKPIELAVIRGFSFVFGVGLGDEETFPAQLAREVELNAYNAARFLDDPDSPEDFDRLMGRVGARPRTVVYVHLEPNAMDMSEASERVDTRRRVLRFAKEWPLQWIRLSPAILWAVDAKKAIENDVLLHNRYQDSVHAFSLPGGQRVLVRKGDLERAETQFDEATVVERADYIVWWKRQMAERGIRTVVLLVPDKMTVYGSALGLRLPADPFLNRMERNLEARGIRVVNGLSILKPHVSQDIATGALAYLREDQHWNRIGVERLAKATAEAIRTNCVLESAEAR